MRTTPPKPSKRLSDLPDLLPAIAAQRGTVPARLLREVTGELDTIVKKALERDRLQRYATVEGARSQRRTVPHGRPSGCRPVFDTVSFSQICEEALRGLHHSGVLRCYLVGMSLFSTWLAFSAIRAGWRAEMALDDANAMIEFFKHDVFGAASQTSCSTSKTRPSWTLLPELTRR